MSGSKDSGISVVIAFVTILAIIAMAVGMWALLGVPGQVREVSELHALDVVDSFTDYRVLLTDLKTNDSSIGVNLSTIIPVGSEYSPGSFYTEDTVGTLVMNITTLNGFDETRWNITRLVVDAGDAGKVGFEGGGVFRSNDGNYSWSVMPEFRVFNKSGSFYLYLKTAEVIGDFDMGSTGTAAFETYYSDKNLPNSDFFAMNIGATADNKSKMHIAYYTDDIADAVMWYSMFYETVYAYNDGFSVGVADNHPFNSDNISVSFPTQPEFIDGKYVVYVDIRSDGTYRVNGEAAGYTYNVNLVPDYVVVEMADDGKYFTLGSNNGDGYNTVAELNTSLNKWFGDNYDGGVLSKETTTGHLSFNATAVEQIGFNVSIDGAERYAIPIANEPIKITNDMELTLNKENAGSEFTLDDIIFARAGVYTDGPVIEIMDGGTLTATGANLILHGKDVACSAPLLVIHETGSLESGSSYRFMNNSNTISGGSYGGLGGAIYNMRTSSGISFGGTIENNKAISGGGLYNAGTFTLSGGFIKNNYAEKGGGVYNAGTFNYNSGSITSNDAVIGKSFYAESTSTNSWSLTSKLTGADGSNKYSDDNIQ